MYWCTALFERIKRYYYKTFVTIPEVHGLLYVSEVSPTKVVLKSLDDQLYIIDLTNGYNMEFTLPVNKIYFQHAKHTYLLARYPARQYKRGISVENTCLLKLTATGHSAVEVSWEIMNSFVNKQPYTSIDDAVLLFSKGTGDFISVALTHRIAITKKLMLFIDDVYVGKVDRKKKLVIVSAPYRQVFVDFLSKTNSAYSVC